MSKDINFIAAHMTKEEFFTEVFNNYAGEYISDCPMQFGLPGKYVYSKDEDGNDLCECENGEKQCKDCFECALKDIQFIETKMGVDADDNKLGI
jgi:hypothetical protein